MQTTHQTPTPTPATIARPGVPRDPGDVAALEAWFDELAAEHTHPASVTARLRRTGWDDPDLGWADRRYRSRFPGHPATWWGGFTAIGMAALAVAGVLHSLIDGHRTTAAAWFGVALVALVFGAVATGLMNRLADDGSQRFSAARRRAATTLFWAAIGVAVLRGLVFGQVLGHELLVGDHCHTTFGWDDTAREPIATEVCDDRGPEALGHLALTVAIATPIACWAWYAHRRPTDPPDVEALTGT